MTLPETEPSSGGNALSARDARNAAAAALPLQPQRHAAAMRSVTDALGGRIAYGGDYNPEQWSQEVWREDIALMREGGVNLVSLGIFSWAWLQPKPGLFEFGWLDTILDMLHQGGIRVDLANASASPPPWFSHQNPETMPVDVDGVRRWYGARQTFCPSSPIYRAATAELTRAIVARYADHPAVVMWHVHNEYGCHNATCYCDVSATAFRSWLQRRYGDLSELNAAWGTAFWSQRYFDWEEVMPPRRVAYHTFANPTQQLDFARFSSDELLDCYRREAAIIRAGSDKPVTTNFMSFFQPLDYWQWAQDMDIVSNDHYRITAMGERAATHDLVMSGDLMRSLADGEPWLLMEHSTSAVNWQARNPAKAAGVQRADSLTHVARGADGILYFQWRASAAGAEKFHSALVPHAGTDTRRWRETVQLGSDLAAISELRGSRVQAAIAIAFDWQSWWGSALDSHPSVDLTTLGQVRAWHRALWELGFTCDFVHPDRPLDGYRVVLVPALYACGDEFGPALQRYVMAGGHVVVGPLSGVVDLDDHIRLGGYPGALRDLMGIRIEEFSPLLEGETVGLHAAVVHGPDPAAVGDDARATVWTELVVPNGAEVVATFGGGVFDAEPAITCRQFPPVGLASSGGSAWYFATVPEVAVLESLLSRIVDAAGVAPAPGAGSGMDVTVRQSPDARYVCAVNRSAKPLALPAAGLELLTGLPWSDADELPSGGVAVVRQDRH